MSLQKSDTLQEIGNLSVGNKGKKYASHGILCI